MSRVALKGIWSISRRVGSFHGKYGGNSDGLFLLLNELMISKLY